MTPFRSTRLLLAGLPLLFAALSLHAANSSEVRFTDPTKPGRLKVYISNGELHITPGDKPGVVTVNSQGELKAAKVVREDGLRVLSDASDVFSLTSDGNKAELTYGRDGLPGGAEANLTITVPKDTTLEIQNGWGGSVDVKDIEGDLSLKAMNCDVTLSDVSGATSIETMNGAIQANYRSLPAGKPISISTMNGEVTLRVPEDAKANVRFRTHNGSILTDFSEDRLKTTSENLGGTNWGAMAGKHVAVAVHIAREVGKEIASAAREAAEAEREAAEAQREADQEAAEAQREADQEMAESQKEADKAGPNAKPEHVEAPKMPAPPAPKAKAHMPHPPTPPNIPAISGGKVVSGALNGGGTQVQITTMNGDITFRRR
jgi:hypothetical protein